MSRGSGWPTKRDRIGHVGTRSLMPAQALVLANMAPRMDRGSSRLRWDFVFQNSTFGQGSGSEAGAMPRARADIVSSLGEASPDRIEPDIRAGRFELARRGAARVDVRAQFGGTAIAIPYATDEVGPCDCLPYYEIVTKCLWRDQFQSRVLALAFSNETSERCVTLSSPASSRSCKSKQPTKRDCSGRLSPPRKTIRLRAYLGEEAKFTDRKEQIAKR